MNYYYILIKGIKKLNNIDLDILISLLKDLMKVPKFEFKEDILIITDKDKEEISWEEFIVGTNNELFSNLKLYESVSFNDEKTLSKNLIDTINTDLFKYTYNNDKTILLNNFDNQITETLKKTIFKELYYDLEFLRSIKTYLIENQNTSKAAKSSNLHRNTLINRIEKFERITNLNLKNYEDAIFVYLLLKNL